MRVWFSPEFIVRVAFQPMPNLTAAEGGSSGPGMRRASSPVLPMDKVRPWVAFANVVVNCHLLEARQCLWRKRISLFRFALSACGRDACLVMRGVAPLALGWLACCSCHNCVWLKQSVGRNVHFFDHGPSDAVLLISWILGTRHRHLAPLALRQTSRVSAPASSRPRLHNPRW